MWTETIIWRLAAKFKIWRCCVIRHSLCHTTRTRSDGCGVVVILFDTFLHHLLPVCLVHVRIVTGHHLQITSCTWMAIEILDEAVQDKVTCRSAAPAPGHDWELSK